jgi:integrase
MTDLVPLQDNLPASSNPVLVYLSGLTSDKSRRVQQSGLAAILLLMNDSDGGLPDNLVMTFPWHELRFQHTQAIRSRLVEAGYATATINSRLSALRGVLHACWKLGLMSAEDYHSAVDVKNVKGQRLMPGRDIPPDELRAMLLSCYTDGIKGIRDLAVLGLLATTGLRRAEFSALDLSDYNRETGALKVVGKGRKERLVYVTNTTRTLLDRWLKYRGQQPGPLFYAIRKGGYMTRARMKAEAAYDMVKYRAEACGLETVSPHDFRRTFIGNMLDAGVDTVTLAKITGHASSDMLSVYDRRPERAKADAMGKIDLPL